MTERRLRFVLNDQCEGEEVLYLHHAGGFKPLVSSVDNRVEHGLAHKKVAHPLRDDDVDCSAKTGPG